MLDQKATHSSFIKSSEQTAVFVAPVPVANPYQPTHRQAPQPPQQIDAPLSRSLAFRPGDGIPSYPFHLCSDAHPIPLPDRPHRFRLHVHPPSQRTPASRAFDGPAAPPGRSGMSRRCAAHHQGSPRVPTRRLCDRTLDALAHCRGRRRRPRPMHPKAPTGHSMLAATMAWCPATHGRG